MQPLPTDDDGRAGERAPAALELVNERLEKAIEQLRLANKALEVTGHELGALNNQLEMMHDEMDKLSQEVVRLREPARDEVVAVWERNEVDSAAS
jgi:hypothetical protein